MLTGRTIRKVPTLAALVLLLAVAACEDRDKPYVKLLGGGFILNYRIGEVHYGFTAAIVRPVPVGTILEVEFEDPAGGPPFVERRRAGRNALRYSFRTPALEGVRAGTPYRAELRLLDRETGALLARYERSYTSNVGSEAMPAGPLAVGPGYHRPPERR